MSQLTIDTARVARCWLLVGLVALAAGCGDGLAGSTPAGDGAIVDAGAPVTDAGPVAPQADADSLATDAGASQLATDGLLVSSDASTGGEDLAPDGTVADGPLEPSFDGHYQEYAPPGPLDLTTLVSGGQPPYSCAFYAKKGRGTVPGGLTLDGCTLQGGFDATEAPGLYGFIVVVADAAGDTVEVPIAARNGSCTSAAAKITPPPAPGQSLAAGAGQTWHLVMDDVDAPCVDGGCSQCNFCLNYSFDIQSLSIAPALICGSSGDLCLINAGFSQLGGCPGFQVSWSADLVLDDHAPLRSDGRLGWITLDAFIQYSGATLSPTCGDKRWRCHWETAELP